MKSRRKYDDPRVACLVVRCFMRGKRVALSLLRLLSLRDKDRLMRDLWESGRTVWSWLVLIALPLNHKAYGQLSPSAAEQVTRIVVGLDPIPVY